MGGGNERERKRWWDDETQQHLKRDGKKEHEHKTERRQGGGNNEKKVTGDETWCHTATCRRKFKVSQKCSLAPCLDSDQSEKVTFIKEQRLLLVYISE